MREQYASEENLAARKTAYANIEGLDTRDVLVETNPAVERLPLAEPLRARRSSTIFVAETG